MKYNKKKIGIVFLAAWISLIGATVYSVPVLAQSITTTSSEQDDTGYIKGRPLTEYEIAIQKALEPDTFEYQDNGYDIPSVEEDSTSSFISPNSYSNPVLSSILPASYDLRDHDRVSSVKNQNPYGTCWAFAAVSAAESNLMTDNVTANSSINLSELQLAYYTYHKTGDALGGTSGDTIYLPDTDNFLQSGGSSYLSTFALADWTGIVNDSLAPYSSLNTTMTLNPSLEYNQDAAHLQNASWISMKDMNTVKQMIISEGAPTVSYFHNESYMNYSYGAYYNSLNMSTNHAVTLVGWNDDYPASQFNSSNTLPTNNGAWLIKNSWGSSWGQSGYFWISYEDISLLTSDAFFFDFEDVNNYQHNYQYDGSGYLGSYPSSNKGYMANVFTAHGDETLQAVSFYTDEPNINYSIQVYTNLTSSTDPTDGTKAFTVEQSGVQPYAGYHTINLTQPVSLQKNSKFSVVVKLEVSDGLVFLMTDSTDTWGWVSFTSTASPGQSFFSANNTSWSDIGESDGNNFRIKAFTDASFDIASSNITVSPIANQTYTGSAILPSLTVMDGPSLLTEGVHYTLSGNSINAGAATVQINEMGLYTNSFQKSFVITPKSITTATVLPIADQPYTGTNITPKVTVTSGSSTLIEGQDYTLSYLNNTKVGTATAIITGFGNFCDTANLSFHIYEMTSTPAPTATAAPTATPTAAATVSPTTAINLSSSSIKKITNQTYSGKAITPKITVMYHNVALKLNQDYSITYSNNKKTGLATVTVLGKGRYSGTKKITFIIVPKVVTFSSIKSTKTKTATLSWKKTTGATGYQVSYATSKKGRYQSAGSSTSLSFIQKNLKKGKTYYFKVRAYKTILNTRQYGAYSAIKSVKIK